MMPQKENQRNKVRYSGSVDVIDSSTNILDSSLESSDIVDPKLTNSHDGYNSDIRSNPCKKTFVKGGSLNNLSKKRKSKAMRKYKISFSYSCASDQLASDINPKIINLQRLDHITTRSDHQFVSDKLKPVMTCIVQKLINEYRRSKDPSKENDVEAKSSGFNTYTLSSSSCDNLAIAQLRSDFENETNHTSVKSSNLIKFYQERNKHPRSTNDELQSEVKHRLLSYSKPLTRCSSLSHVGFRNLNHIIPKQWKNIPPSFVRDGYLFKRSKITNNLNVNIKSLLNKVTISHSLDNLINKGDCNFLEVYSAINKYSNKVQIEETFVPFMSFLRNVHLPEFSLTKEIILEKVTENPFPHFLHVESNIESLASSKPPSMHGSNYSNENDDIDEENKKSPLDRPLSPIENNVIEIQNKSKNDPAVKSCKMLQEMSRKPKRSPKDDDTSSSQYSVISTCQICLGDPVLCFESECRKSLIERYVDLLEEAEGVTVKRLSDKTIDMENLKSLLYKFMEDKNAYPSQEVKQDIHKRQSYASSSGGVVSPIKEEEDSNEDEDYEKVKSLRRKSMFEIDKMVVDFLYDNNENIAAELIDNKTKSILKETRASNIGMMRPDYTNQMNDSESEENVDHSTEMDKKQKSHKKQRQTTSIVETVVTTVIEEDDEISDNNLGSPHNRVDQSSMYLERDVYNNKVPSKQSSVYTTEKVIETTNFDDVDSDSPEPFEPTKAGVFKEMKNFENGENVTTTINKSRTSVISRNEPKQRLTTKNERQSTNMGTRVIDPTQNLKDNTMERHSQYISTDVLPHRKDDNVSGNRRSMADRQSIQRQSFRPSAHPQENYGRPNPAIEVDQFSSNDIIVEIDDHQTAKIRTSVVVDGVINPGSSINKFDDHHLEKGRRTSAVSGTHKNITPDINHLSKQRKHSVPSVINKSSPQGNKADVRQSIQSKKSGMIDGGNRPGGGSGKVEDRQSMKQRKSIPGFDGNDPHHNDLGPSPRDYNKTEPDVIHSPDFNKPPENAFKTPYGNDGQEHIVTHTTQTVRKMSHVTSSNVGHIDNNQDNLPNKPGQHSAERQSQIDKNLQTLLETGSQTDQLNRMSSSEKKIQTEILDAQNDTDKSSTNERNAGERDKSPHDQMANLNERNSEIDGILNKLKLILHQSEEYLQRFPNLLNNSLDPNHEKQNGVNIPKDLFCLLKNLCQKEDAGYISNNERYKNLDQNLEHICKYLNGIEHADANRNSLRPPNDLGYNCVSEGARNERPIVDFDQSQCSDSDAMFDRLVRCVMQKLLENQNQLYAAQGTSGPVKCADNDFNHHQQKRPKCRSNLSLSQENLDLMDREVRSPFDNQWNGSDHFQYSAPSSHNYPSRNHASTSSNIDSIIAKCLPPETNELVERVRSKHGKLKNMDNLNVYEEISCRMKQLLQQVKRSQQALQPRYSNARSQFTNVNGKERSAPSRGGAFRFPRSHSMSNITDNTQCSDRVVTRHTVASIQNIKSNTNQARKIKSGFRNIRKELRDKTNRSVLNRARQKMLCSALKEDNISNSTFKSKVAIKSVNKRQISR